MEIYMSMYGDRGDEELGWGLCCDINKPLFRFR